VRLSEPQRFASYYLILSRPNSFGGNSGGNFLDRSDEVAVYVAGAIVVKEPLPGSVALLEKVQARLGPNRLPLLIAIDGPDGVGKSSLASWLAWQVGAPSVHLDLYLNRDSKPLSWKVAELRRIVGTRVGGGQPVVVEGVMILDALTAIGRKADFLVSGRRRRVHSFGAARRLPGAASA
jgi:hypothetical protein